MEGSFVQLQYCPEHGTSVLRLDECMVAHLMEVDDLRLEQGVVAHLM